MNVNDVLGRMTYDEALDALYQLLDWVVTDEDVLIRVTEWAKEKPEGRADELALTLQPYIDSDD